MAESSFYGDAKEYWCKVQPNVNGVMGGFAHISSTDIGGSTQFIRQFIRGPDAKVKCKKALDCGAGIGRVTGLLLVPHFESVDMVDFNQAFLDAVPQYLGEKAKKVDKRICAGLQHFIPEVGHYDLIWCQWVLGHLTDEDLIVFFQRCQRALSENGIIVVKENVTPSDHSNFDKLDSSITRSRQQLVDVIDRSGLKILREDRQKNFPKDLYDVRMFALQ